MSFKLTPFYTWVSNWQQQTFIGAGFATQVPVGVNRNEGVEAQFNKGDFTRNGLSGLLAVTYTNSKVMFQNVPLSTGGTITSDAHCAQPGDRAVQRLDQVRRRQPLLPGRLMRYRARRPTARKSRATTRFSTRTTTWLRKVCSTTGGWYNPYSTAIAPNLNGAVGSYISPWVSSLILNWRHDKLAVTPSFSFQTGGYYGSPLDNDRLRSARLRAQLGGDRHYEGLAEDQSAAVQLPHDDLGRFGAFTYLYIPNPQTGTFLFDNYQQPSSIVGNLQITYDVSPRIRLTVLGDQPLPRVLRRYVGTVDGGLSTELRHLRIYAGRRFVEQHALSEQLLQRHEHQRHKQPMVRGRRGPRATYRPARTTVPSAPRFNRSTSTSTRK